MQNLVSTFLYYNYSTFKENQRTSKSLIYLITFLIICGHKTAYKFIYKDYGEAIQFMIKVKL